MAEIKKLLKPNIFYIKRGLKNLKKGHAQRATSSYVFQDNGVDYLYSVDVSGVSLGEVRDRSLKDVLVEDNTAFVLRGVLVHPISAQPNHTGNAVLYTGVKAGKHCFRFKFYFHGDNAATNPFFDIYSKKADRLSD